MTFFIELMYMSLTIHNDNEGGRMYTQTSPIGNSVLRGPYPSLQQPGPGKQVCAVIDK